MSTKIGLAVWMSGVSQVLSVSDIQSCGLRCPTLSALFFLTASRTFAVQHTSFLGFREGDDLVARLADNHFHEKSPSRGIVTASINVSLLV
jgi:hypothetical protein